MALLLPLRNDAAHFLFEVDLDGKAYGFELRWNERAAGWFLHLSDATGTRLVSGIRLVPGWPLLRRWQDARMPAGELEVLDTSGQSLEPTYGDLGTRVLMLYTTAAELAELEAAA
jgi:hypothetical protein